MRIKFWAIFVLHLIIISLSGCQKENTPVDTVKIFLKEKDTAQKLLYVREGSEYLKSHTNSDLLKNLPKKYIEIKESDESVNDNEIIVDVVLEKLSIGGKPVNKLQEFFVLKDKDSKYKIDLDASFNETDTRLNSLIENGNEFSIELRALLSDASSYNKGMILNGKKALMWVEEHETNQRFVILDENLKEYLKQKFSVSWLKHLIIKVSYLPNDREYITIDSVLQEGWIKR